MITKINNRSAIDLYHDLAILFFFHSKQCNQTEAGSKNRLVSLYVMRISTIIVNEYTLNMTQGGHSVITVYEGVYPLFIAWGNV